jgi:hypothetical protein
MSRCGAWRRARGRGCVDLGPKLGRPLRRHRRDHPACGQSPPGGGAAAHPFRLSPRPRRPAPRRVGRVRPAARTALPLRAGRPPRESIAARTAITIPTRPRRDPRRRADPSPLACLRDARPGFAPLTPGERPRGCRPSGCRPSQARRPWPACSRHHAPAARASALRRCQRQPERYMRPRHLLHRANEVQVGRERAC